MTKLSGYLRRHHVALLALVVALGGTSYAAVQLPPGSVGTAQLKNKAVTFKKIEPSTRQRLQGQTGPAGAQGAPGAPGTAGQSVTTVYGTGQLVVTAATSFTVVPGLTQTVVVPAGATVLVSTDGGAQNTGVGSTYATVDLALFVDGQPSSEAGQRRLVMANTASVAQVIESWSFGRSLSLTTGSHTIDVRAAGVDPNAANANVSSASAPQLQGQLTVVVVKQ